MGCISDADNPLEAAHSGASNVATWMRMYKFTGGGHNALRK